jgi:hypothetical protein
MKIVKTLYSQSRAMETLPHQVFAIPSRSRLSSQFD